MTEFLVRQAHKEKIQVGILRNYRGLEIPNRKQGTKLAKLASRFGWSVSSRGLYFSFDFYDDHKVVQQPTGDEAQQLKVLRDAFSADGYPDGPMFGIYSLELRVKVREEEEKPKPKELSKK